MDDKDHEILKLVQGDARMTAEVIGFEIGLSPPAVQKRLKKLRETGVIEREIAVLSTKRSEEHTSELQSPVPISYAVFCLKKKKKQTKSLNLLDIR